MQRSRFTAAQFENPNRTGMTLRALEHTRVNYNPFIHLLKYVATKKDRADLIPIIFTGDMERSRAGY